MSWTRYLLHDFWTAREFNRIDDQRRSGRRAERRAARRHTAEVRALEARVEELEGDLAEAALLLRTLSDLCVQKGLVSAEEVMARAEYLDGLDGVVDGRLGEPVDGSGEADR
jgi:hypothetical protein